MRLNLEFTPCCADQDVWMRKAIKSNDSIGPPTRYLGATISEYHVPGDNSPKWAIGSEQMMGIPLEGYAHVKVDNMSVVKNSSVPESQLKKKSNSVAYHFVRQVAAADIGRISYEPSDTNLADSRNGQATISKMGAVLGYSSLCVRATVPKVVGAHL